MRLREAIRSHLRGRSIAHVAEQGGRQAWLESEITGLRAYRAFDARPILPGVETHEPADPLPLEDASQELVLTLHLFERLRMQQLYMVAAESRRILRPGGLWLLSGQSFSESAWRRFWESLVRKAKGENALELTHYISPEDWRTLEDAKWLENGLTQQFLALERI
jgi:hypothetical protein